MKDKGTEKQEFCKHHFIEDLGVFTCKKCGLISSLIEVRNTNVSNWQFEDVSLDDENVMLVR